MRAAANNSPEAVKVLINAGANVKAKDLKGLTALMWAAANNSSPEVVKVLINAGSEVDAKDNEAGSTALMLAVMKNKNAPEIVNVLLEAGADINVKAEGLTVLTGALFFSTNLKLIMSLIEAGADVNAIDKDGMTALMCTAAGNTPEIVTALIHAGADVSAKDKDGKTALDYALGKVAVFEFEANSKLRGTNALKMLGVSSAKSQSNKQMRAYPTGNKVNIRSKPKTGKVLFQVSRDSNEILIVEGSPVNYDGEDWYKVLRVYVEDSDFDEKANGFIVGRYIRLEPIDD